MLFSAESAMKWQNVAITTITTAVAAMTCGVDRRIFDEMATLGATITTSSKRTV
jgi:hypothetical protein